MDVVGGRKEPRGRRGLTAATGAGPVRADLPTIQVNPHPEVDLGPGQMLVARAQALEDADNLQKIKRIVVLVQENRSFDHMLGYLSLPPSAGGKGRADINGHKLGQPAGGPEIRKLTDGVFLNNPGHSVGRVRTQIADGAMTGFVDDFADVVARAKEEHPNRSHEAAEQIMGYHTAATVPVYDVLAQHFTVCDRWFSCIPGPTWPNRMFLYAGTANGKTTNGGSSIATYRDYSPGMPTNLIVDELDQAGVEWGIYRGSLIPWMRLFPSFLPDADSRPHRQKRRERKGRVKRYERFDNDCRQGDLPPVVFIDGNANAFRSQPGGSNDDDQAPADIARGQELVGEVYESLRTTGELAETMFVVTYDEHGGFYDHVRPDDVLKDATGKDPEFKTYGVRVPALVISPFVEPHSVFTDRLDHTSVTHSILLRFCPGQAMTTRVSIARNLGQVLTRDTARATLPSAAAAVQAAKDGRSGRTGNPDPETEVAASLLALLGL
jgi:phospholipase C